MIPIVQALVANGLSLIGNAVMAKGKEWVEEKTGVKLPDDGNIPNEKLVELRKAEMEHEEELQRIRLEDDRLALEEAKAYLLDTQNARKMQEVALGQSDLFSKRFIYYLASFWSFASVLYIGTITFFPVHDHALRIVDTVLGFMLGTVTSTIINYFFGSSKGSHSKDESIKDMVSVIRK